MENNTENERVLFVEIILFHCDHLAFKVDIFFFSGCWDKLIEVSIIIFVIVVDCQHLGIF